VALTALVAIESLGLGARQVLNGCADKVVARLRVLTDNGSVAGSTVEISQL
jgi:hypothetical protein